MLFVRDFANFLFGLYICLRHNGFSFFKWFTTFFFYVGVCFEKVSSKPNHQAHMLKRTKLQKIKSNKNKNLLSPCPFFFPFYRGSCICFNRGAKSKSNLPYTSDVFFCLPVAVRFSFQELTQFVYVSCHFFVFTLLFSCILSSVSILESFDADCT